jgi:hypothetical protein
MRNGTGFVEDGQGQEFAGEDEARQEAMLAARDIMAGELRAGALDLTARIEVTDAEGKLLFSLIFADAVTITSR